MGVPSDAAAALVLRLAQEKLEEELLRTVISAHIVPKCAMSVQRNEEMGPLVPYKPDYPCGCFFDLAANGKSTCRQCALPGECDQGQVCSYGYCEAPKK
jgi:hypothetical protein